MTYELAKQLEETGFLPKEGHYPRSYYIDSDRVGFFTSSSEHEKDAVYQPTLSELIEACGAVEFRLHFYPKGFGSDVTDEAWFVIERPNWTDMPRCSTPEEAVAKLWLELNKNMEKKEQGF